MVKEMTLLPVISYDEGRLREVLESVPAFGGKSQEERTVSIQKTDAGYLLVSSINASIFPSSGLMFPASS